MTIADLDNDGIEDIVTANKASDDVSVLLGRANGSFKNAQSFSLAGASNLPVAVTTGDLNDDGNLDVIVGNRAEIVSVLLGNGDGSLQGAQYFNDVPSSFPDDINNVNVGVLDINDDDVLDVISYKFYEAEDGDERELGILLGSGDGTLQAAEAYSDPPFGSDMAVADMDRDGRRDLVFNNEAPVLLNDGNGAFEQGDAYDFCTTQDCRVSWVSVADVNGDGRLDAAFANNLGENRYEFIDYYGTQGVSVLLGNGDGTFEEDPINISYESDINFGDMAAADLDGDDAAEIIVIHNEDLAVFSIPGS